MFRGGHQFSRYLEILTESHELIGSVDMRAMRCLEGKGAWLINASKFPYEIHMTTNGADLGRSILI